MFSFNTNSPLLRAKICFFIIPPFSHNVHCSLLTCSPVVDSDLLAGGDGGGGGDAADETKPRVVEDVCLTVGLETVAHLQIKLS